MKPGYFDLSVTNMEVAVDFFKNVLNWKFRKMDMPYEYYTIEAGEENEYGINGGMGAVGEAELAKGPLTVLTVPVTDLDSMLEKVQSSGGKIVEQKTEIPGIGYYATCAEPGGLMFGMIQPFGEQQ